MGIRNGIAHWLFKGLPGNSGFSSLFSGNGSLFWNKEQATQNTALQISTVWACVRNLSEDVAKLKPEVFQVTENESGKTRKVAKDHPLRKILRKPNAYQDRFQFFETMMLHLTLRGNAYSVIQRDARGRPTSLSPIHPDRVTVLEAYDGEIFYQVTAGGPFEKAQVGERLFVPARDMLHVRGLSANGLIGLSPLQAASAAINLAKSAEEHQGKLFTNGARPGGVLKHPGSISKEAATRLLAAWMGSYGGAENTGKTALLEEGMEWQQLGMTSVDAEFLATRRFTVEELARFFRMPLHMVGDLSRSTNNNIAFQGLEYYKNTVSGYLERIEAAFTDKFELPEEVIFEFDITALMRLDQATQIKALRDGKVAGILTTNEVRQSMGLNPVEGGDVLLQPLNMGVNGEQDTTPAEPDPQDPKEPADA